MDVMALIVGPVLQEEHITLLLYLLLISTDMTLNFSSFVSIYIWHHFGGKGQGNARDVLTYTEEERKLLFDRSFLLFPHE